MRKVLLFLGLIISVTFMSYAQDAEKSTELKKDPLKDYLRPSLTTLFINRGEPLSEQIGRAHV